MKLGIEHTVMLHSCNMGKNQGEIKLILKVNDKNDQVSKLIGRLACEDNVPKFTAKHFKKIIAKRI